MARKSPTLHGGDGAREGDTVRASGDTYDVGTILRAYNGEYHPSQ